jgi:hypothetical protein
VVTGDVGDASENNQFLARAEPSVLRLPMPVFVHRTLTD